jgi:hypothetical protein
MKDKPALAFPHTWEATDGTTIIAKGMTLRDYFAAKALQALIIREGKDALYINEITTTAYQYADDMLQEREA